MAETLTGPKTRCDGRYLAVLGFVAFAIWSWSGAALAQGAEQNTAATIDTTSDAGEADAVPPRRRLVKWNDYDGPISTLHFGLGFVYDISSFVQDDASRQQVSMPTDNGLRDFRVLAKGRFKTERGLSWTLGYMWDAADENWHFRQTGVQVDLPELSGRVFIGRTKEGYSQAKVMVGHYIVNVERAQTLDAFIPILADGIKYMGYYPKKRLFLNLGYFFDGLTIQSEKEKFALYDNQAVVRLGWQPYLSEAEHRAGHIALMSRFTTPDEGKIRLKSKPGAWLAPNFLDTGTLTADKSHTYGIEANYRTGPWLFASEYDWQDLELTGGGKPLFHGGEVTATWMITGEVRPYNASGGFYQQIATKRSVFEGGRGALETTLGFTYSDFEEGSIDGGKFWRVTPMLKWYLADELGFVGAYGFGELDRFGVTGRTQFFQGRIFIIL